VSGRFLLTHLLRDSVARSPDAPAVRCRDDQLTYRELDETSNAVARALAEGGVSRGDRVVLHAPKSVAAVAAAYGVMKAGASYVPVEPGSPAPRLAAIVEQCRPSGIVTCSDAREKLTAELCRGAGLDCVVALDGADAFADLPARSVALDDALEGDLTALPDRGVVDRDLA